MQHIHCVSILAECLIGKNCVQTDQATEASEDQSASSSSSARGFASRQQVQVPRQPVLQSAGYSGSGGVQVELHEQNL